MQGCREPFFRIYVRSAVDANRQMREKVFSFLSLEVIVEVAQCFDRTLIAAVHDEPSGLDA